MRALTAVLGIILMGLCAQSLQAAESPWKLRINKEDIAVYTRKVDGSAILEYKANTVVNAPIEKTIAFFEDASKMPSWFYQCVEAKPVPSQDSQEQITYFAMHLPWPVAERDSVFSKVKTVDPSTGVVEYTLSARPDEYPRQQGRVRVIYLKTTWRFTPLPNGQTEIYFQQHSDPGGSIPAMIVNKLVVDIPFHSLKNLRKLITSHE
jgi:hypothetical protein